MIELTFVLFLLAIPFAPIYYALEGGKWHGKVTAVLILLIYITPFLMAWWGLR